jgi:hypothetical protein
MIQLIETVDHQWLWKCVKQTVVVVIDPLSTEHPWRSTWINDILLSHRHWIPTCLPLLLLLQALQDCWVRRLLSIFFYINDTRLDLTAFILDKRIGLLLKIALIRNILRVACLSLYQLLMLWCKIGIPRYILASFGVAWGWLCTMTLLWLNGTSWAR